MFQSLDPERMDVKEFMFEGNNGCLAPSGSREAVRLWGRGCNTHQERREVGWKQEQDRRHCRWCVSSHSLIVLPAWEEKEGMEKDNKTALRWTAATQNYISKDSLPLECEGEKTGKCKDERRIEKMEQKKKMKVTEHDKNSSFTMSAERTYMKDYNGQPHSTQVHK